MDLFQEGRTRAFQYLAPGRFGVDRALHGAPVAGRETWRIVFILALVLLTITSTVVIPGVLLPNITSPHPEFLSDDLQDEWSELRQQYGGVVRFVRPGS